MIAVFDKLIENEKPEIVEMTLNLIGNFIIENVGAKNEILNSNLFQTIDKLINTSEKSIGVSRNLAFIISNIVNQKKPYLNEKIVEF